ncbi:MAG: Ig-like domain-containing protein [Roseburia sp.]|nr:Ig-like domain-containing protein [Roseburia sp.]MCM1098631.1 Ig-like domain-containing protein [Ruminococcus flavefaciens]
MKKLFHHTKQPLEKWFEYEDENYEASYEEDGEDYADEPSYEEPEDYADEPPYEEPEDYADEPPYEEPEDCADESSCEEPEDYADESSYEEMEDYSGESSYVEDGEYEEDGGDGQAYEGGPDSVEEEFSGDVQVDQDEIGYTEEEEEYAGDFEGEISYAEESYEDGGDFEGEIIYTEEPEDYIGEEEYAESDGDEAAEPVYEEYAGDFEGEGDYAEESCEDAEDEAAAGLRGMSVIDRLIAFTGVAVLVLALITGGVFISGRIKQGQVKEFVSVGAQLEDISVIGEAGLLAVADARKAQIAASVIVEENREEENEENKAYEEYEETDYSRQVTVKMDMSSIQKDLKIKFTNQKTGKLIANVPFSVTVKDPDGKTSIWSDDDMDGIIYKKDITAGSYEVAMEKLTDEQYSKYSIDTDKKKVKVKKEIAYEKVDVANEVKKESEVDAKTEDTAKKEVAVESVMQDTVAWVESKEVGNVYTEVTKDTIPNPLTLASLPKSFLRMDTQAAISPAALELEPGKTGALTVGAFAPSLNQGELSVKETGRDVEWSSNQNAVATVDQNGVVTAAAEGTATITYAATVTYEVQKTDSSVSASDPAAVTTETRTEKVTGTCVVTVKAARGALSLTVDKKNATVVVGGSATAQAAASGAAEGQELIFAAKSDQETIATAVVDNAGKITITGVAAGTARITVTVNYKEGAAETAGTAVIDVVVGGNKTVALEKQTCTAYVANLVLLNATIGNVLEPEASVTAVSSDASILKVTLGTMKTENGVTTVPVTLEGLKEGSVVLTVKCVENGEEVQAECVVTVKPDPKQDVKTELKDQDGMQVYVVENNEYRKAFYADYFKFEKFYISTGKKYTGWQTIDGKVYYFNADGEKLTGEQVIQGAKYNFASDGALIQGNGLPGIDVSKWNGTIDWAAVKNSGVDYVIIRCGYRGSSAGKLVEDPKFTTNIKGATAAGLKVGIYFFTQAVDEREAVEEASMVLEQIRNYKISYPVFLDVESSGGRADSISKETRTAVCKAFCQTIQNAGYTAGIYANKHWLETKINAGELNAYKIWLAQYATRPTYTGKYDIWQYRSTGKVTGISGNVDLNLSYMGY